MNFIANAFMYALNVHSARHRIMEFNDRNGKQSQVEKYPHLLLSKQYGNSKHYSMTSIDNSVAYTQLVNNGRQKSEKSSSIRLLYKKRRIFLIQPPVYQHNN